MLKSWPPPPGEVDDGSSYAIATLSPAVAQKLDDSRTVGALMAQFKYWGPAIYGLKWVPTEDVPTMATNGRNLFFNPKFVEQESPAINTTGIIHEAFHVVMGDIGGYGRRDMIVEKDGNRFRLYYIAADHANNLMLKAAGLDMPTWALADLRFVRKDKQVMTAPEIYDILAEEVKNGQSCLPSVGTGKNGKPGTHVLNGGCRVLDHDQSMTHEEHALNRERMARRVLTGMKMQGIEQGALYDILQGMLAVKYDFRIIEQMLREVTESVWDSWAIPDRRMLAVTGDVFPSPEEEPKGEIVLVGDTSGSIGDTELKYFLGWLNGVLRGIPFLRVTYLPCDTLVHQEGIREYSRFNLPIAALPAHGRGGTDFRPPFQWVEAENRRPDLLIYLTDMEGIFPKEAPEYPVVWVSTKGHKKAPFGLVTHLDCGS